MAISTFKVFLMMKGASAYEKVVDVKEYPDLGKAPDTIDVTTLSDPSRKYIDDIQDPGNLEFNANYDKDDFAKLEALKGQEKEYAIWFGGTEAEGVVTPTGSEGKFEFKGYLNAWVKGGGVSAAVDMGISIAPSTAIVSKSA